MEQFRKSSGRSGIWGCQNAREAILKGDFETGSED
jgi:hypothetical protein